MPSVLDAPELIEHIETHELATRALPIKRPQVRKARPGFWRTLARGLSKQLPRTSRAQQAPSYSRPRPHETPMDRVTREQPWISISALAIV